MTVSSLVEKLLVYIHSFSLHKTFRGRKAKRCNDANKMILNAVRWDENERRGNHLPHRKVSEGGEQLDQSCQEEEEWEDQRCLWEGVKRSQGRLRQLVMKIIRYWAIDYTKKGTEESEYENLDSQAIKMGALYKGAGTDIGLIQSKKEWENECVALREIQEGAD